MSYVNSDKENRPVICGKCGKWLSHFEKFNNKEGLCDECIAKGLTLCQTR